MTFSRRPESPDNQERREAFREQAAAPDVTVLRCRIPSELHRRLRHLVVDEDSSVTAKMTIQPLPQNSGALAPAGLTLQDQRRIRAALGSSTSANTRRAYDQAWRRSVAWTEARGAILALNIRP